MADAGRLKQVNMTLIREAMRGGGEHSKNELARRTGLSFPTVSRIVDDLVEAGEAKETGKQIHRYLSGWDLSAQQGYTEKTLNSSGICRPHRLIYTGKTGKIDSILLRIKREDTIP